eukprot:scaffold11825_cov51-Isochrysis_galbana.AAC.1
MGEGGGGDCQISVDGVDGGVTGDISAASIGNDGGEFGIGGVEGGVDGVTNGGVDGGSDGGVDGGSYGGVDGGSYGG